MNLDESLALYRKGRDAWNAWARERLAEKKALEQSGEWEHDDVQVEWQANARADFEAYIFNDEANFSGFIFPADVSFYSAFFNKLAFFDSVIFKQGTTFYSAIFSEDAFFANTVFDASVSFINANFNGRTNFNFTIFRESSFFDEVDFNEYTYFVCAQFVNQTGFINTTFRKPACFIGTKFIESADFTNATFNKSADFSGGIFGKKSDSNLPSEKGQETKEGVTFLQTTFKAYTNFEGAQFYVTKADFRAMQAERFFSLNNVTFHHCVPDFVQAHFQEAPLLEHFKIPLKRPANTTEEEKKDLPARYRALKRLALQGHDHEREQDFFAAELESLRGVEDFCVGKNAGRFYGGWIYQILSNFGRSIFRPLLWWLLLIEIFAYIYFTLSTTAGSCAAGINRLYAPLFLSLKHAFIALPTSVNERTNQLYACLYGVDENIPIIPDGVATLGIVQTLFSAVIIFLFLLAVRAKFRIK